MKRGETQSQPVPFLKEIILPNVYLLRRVRKSCCYFLIILKNGNCAEVRRRWQRLLGAASTSEDMVDHQATVANSLIKEADVEESLGWSWGLAPMIMPLDLAICYRRGMDGGWIADLRERAWIRVAERPIATLQPPLKLGFVSNGAESGVLLVDGICLGLGVHQCACDI